MAELIKTSLADLGLVFPENRLSLLDQVPVWVVRSSGVGGRSRFVFGVERPMAGGYLHQVLKAVAPSKRFSRSDVVEDLRLPEDAVSEDATGRFAYAVRAHALHANDPVVGEAYLKFVRERLEKWMYALRFRSDVFDFVDELEMSNVEEFGRKYFLWATEGLDRLLAVGKKSFGASDERQVLNGLIDFNQGRDFFEYFKLKFERAKFLGNPKYGLPRYNSSVIFRWLHESEEIACVQEALSGLDEKARVEFGIHLGVKRLKRWLIEVENGVAMIPEKAKVAAVFSNEGAEIGDNQGVKVALSEDSSQPGGFRVESYAFGESYLKRALYPALGWSCDGVGEREQLSKIEVSRLLRSVGWRVGWHTDQVLGLVLVAGLAQEYLVKFGWARRLKKMLKGGHHPMDLAALQTAVWLSVDRHRADLLRNENPVFNKFETIL